MKTIKYYFYFSIGFLIGIWKLLNGEELKVKK